MEAKNSLHGSILVLSLMYGIGTRTMLEGQKSRVRAVEIGYFRSVCGVTWRDMWTTEKDVTQCGAENNGCYRKIKKSTLRWFGQMEIEKLMRKVHLSGVGKIKRRGKPKASWKDNVWEYMGKGGVWMNEGVCGWGPTVMRVNLT